MNIRDPHTVSTRPHAKLVEARARIGARYLAGSGIEIGALDVPTPLHDGVTVRYVDVRTTDELRKQYPDLPQGSLVSVDIVDDGEKLATIADGSLDFVIANHMLEHCENPLGTLRTHLRKVKFGGNLFYAISEVRTGFDAERPRTTFGHLVADDRDDGEASRFGHYIEWEKIANGVCDDLAAYESAQNNIEAGYSIRFHVWESSDLLELFSRARRYLGDTFEVRHFELAGPEVVVVLRRTEQTIPAQPARRPTEDGVSRDRALTYEPSPRKRASPKLREMLGPMSWSVESARIAGDRIDIAGWLYVRDADASTVALRIDGERLVDVALKQSKRPDLSRSMWYTSRNEKAVFRASVPLRGAVANAGVLRLSADWPGADDTWRDRHDVFIPGPAAVDRRHPMPSEDQIALVGGTTSTGQFRLVGCTAFHTLRLAAARYGVDFGNAGTVLDWGIECGRTERFWEGNARIVGCDFDDGVDWCRMHLPGQYERLDANPPTRLRAATFDLIFSVSLMSQLPDASRQAWYSELQRLARPGALVLLSVRGDTAIAKSAMDPHSVELIDEHGSLFVPSGTTMNGQPTRGTTFQRTAAAASEAAQWFDVLEVVPAGINNHQDLLVLRRGGHAE